MQVPRTHKSIYRFVFRWGFMGIPQPDTFMLRIVVSCHGEERMREIGGCYCGSVRYAISGEPLTVYACHCTDCQKASGSAFTIGVILSSQQFRLTSGSIEVDSFQVSGNDLLRNYCANCGSTVWHASPKHEGYISLKGGTLDNKSNLSPVAHLWFRSALPWVQVDPTHKIFDQQPEMSELIELWSHRAT